MYELLCPPLGPKSATPSVRPAMGPALRVHRRRCGRSGIWQSSRWRGSLVLLILPWLPLALTGCGGSAMRGTTAGSLQVSPSSLSFGSVTMGKTATANISLVNLGSAPVQISQLNVTGKSFSVNAQSSLPITLAAAGGSYSLSVQFNPTASGSATGQLTINSDSATNGTAVVGLSGIGAAATPPPSLSAISCTNASMLGSGSDPCSVTLNEAADSGGFTVNLASNSSFVTVPASVTVAAGATSASFSATIGAVSSPQAVTLTASADGTSVGFPLELGVASPGLSVSAASVAFGNVAVNTPVTQLLTLTSTGAADVTISSATLTGAGFSLSGISFPVTLSPGQSTTLTVGFDPTSAGVASGQLSLVSDSASSTTVTLGGTGVPVLTGLSCTNSSITGSQSDACTVTLNAAAATGGFTVGLASNNSAVAVPASVTVAAGATSAGFSASVSAVSTAQTATLTGSAGGVSKTFTLQLNAAIPTLSVSATSLAFGSISVGTSTTQSLTLTSTGTGPVTISSATLAGAGFSVSGATFPLNLNPNQTANLTVQFDPSAAGAATGQLTLASNSSTGASTVISLTGTGVPVLTGLSCANSSMTGAGTDACTVTINVAAVTGGFTVNLASNNSAVTVPASAKVVKGATSVGFTATVSSVSTAQTVTLTASAGSVSDTFSLLLNASAATLSINATSVAFGNVDLNTPATQTVTLTSTGSAPVTVSSATISGANFSFSGATFPMTLSTNQTATLSVQFDPTTAGVATGQLTITSNSSVNPTAAIPLSGTGVTATTYSVSLAWDAPSSSPDPVATYNIYRSPSGASTYQLMGSVSNSTLSYSDSNDIQNGQAYDYIVESVDASGVESSPSNVATVSIP